MSVQVCIQIYNAEGLDLCGLADGRPVHSRGHHALNLTTPEPMITLPSTQSSIFEVLVQTLAHSRSSHTPSSKPPLMGGKGGKKKLLSDQPLRIAQLQVFQQSGQAAVLGSAVAVKVKGPTVLVPLGRIVTEVPGSRGPDKG